MCNDTTGHVDVMADVYLQPDAFVLDSAGPAVPPVAAGSEQQEHEQQSQQAAPPRAQQHASSTQFLMDHLLDSQQARWPDGNPAGGSGGTWSRPESPRVRQAYAGLRDAVFEVVAPRDWAAQLPDPPGMRLTSSSRSIDTRADRTLPGARAPASPRHKRQLRAANVNPPCPALK